MAVVHGVEGRWIDLRVAASGHRFRVLVRARPGDLRRPRPRVDLLLDDARRHFTPVRPGPSDARARDLPAPRGEGRLVVSRPADAWTRFIVDATGHQFRIRARVDAHARVVLEVDGAVEPAPPPAPAADDSRSAAARRLRRLTRLTPDQWRQVAAFQAFGQRVVAAYAAAHPTYASAIEDAVLDGVARAVLTWEGPHAGRLATWVGVSVRSVAANAVRREARRRARARLIWAEAEARDAVGRRNGEPIPARPDPEGAAPAESVGALLAPLKGPRRRLLKLVYVDGYTVEEAATVLGLGHSSAYMLGRAALRQLARALGDIDPARAAAV